MHVPTAAAAAAAFAAMAAVALGLAVLAPVFAVAAYQTVTRSAAPVAMAA